MSSNLRSAADCVVPAGVGVPGAFCDEGAVAACAGAAGVCEDVEDWAGVDGAGLDTGGGFGFETMQMI